ncbi:MAG: hypothetical protein K6F66_05815, partial [Pseudobutyrivibrio sp.]|nr:hypothetical protein [Pseudobutyrivibrio sp.]
MVWAPEVQAKDLVYTALGDSLTDPNTYEGKTWTTYPAYVTNTLSATGNVTLYNHGMGGYKTSDVLNQIKSDEEVINHIKESDIITLQVGANNITAAMLDSLVDAGLISLPFEYYLPEGTNVGACETNAGAVLADKDNGYHANYITSAEADINDIIATIREYNPDARIYIATVYFEQQFFTVLFQGMFALGTTQADYLASEYSISAVELQNYFMDAAAYNDG